MSENTPMIKGNRDDLRGKLGLSGLDVRQAFDSAESSTDWRDFKTCEGCFGAVLDLRR